jgi:hypothetical protein
MGFPILPAQKYRALHRFFLFLRYEPFNFLQEKNYIDQKEAHISLAPKRTTNNFDCCNWMD